MIDFEKVQSLARARKKIEAIKYIKDQSSLALKEAKELVEKLEEGLISPAQAHIHFYPDRDIEVHRGKSAYQFHRIINFISSDKKLRAIKELKKLTKLGLKDCKQIVDALEDKTLTSENLQQAINEINVQKQTVVNNTRTSSTTNSFIIKKRRG